MNLARVEYYFADFLSKLEERSKQPEIELYANHEEELFVSEFSTLLNLIESSIEGKKIKYQVPVHEKILRMSNIASTKIFCPSGGIVQEALFIDALNDTRAWRIDGTHLYLMDEKNTVLAVFEVQ